jgi:hypothetical protein
MKKYLFIIIVILTCFFETTNGQWAANGSNIYNTNSGYVGIGNNAPATLLYVAKSMTEPCITIRNMGGNGGATYTMSDVASGANWKFKVTNIGGFKIRDNANALDIVTIEPNSFANAIYIKSSDNIGIGTSSPNASALMDISSGNKGFLPPRMNHLQMDALVNPADGLIIYCTDCSIDGMGRPAVFFAGSWHILDAYKCSGAPASPTMLDPQQMSHVIKWKWIDVPVADSYKFNSTNDYTTAIDLGDVNSYVETGLEPLNSYTRYLWALNECGISAATVLTGTTPVWGCGDTMMVDHVAGDVAPVTKSVIYGTVTAIPGEPAKCWISQNLGADHQATAINDASEASAGWYWRFNTKRGYMHDGTNRTPNDTWATYVDEDSGWLPANDPCSLELGGDWRLPTLTELTNIFNAGGWTNNNGPWNSELKLHGAGHLEYDSGTLTVRGAMAFYWSGTQWSIDRGGYMFFYTGGAWMSGEMKGYAHALRCIK